MAIVLASAALGFAGALWALSEYQSTNHLRKALRVATAHARTLLSARDAWLSAGRESLLVWGADMAEPLSFGEGAELMQACLSGPQALELSTALDGLAANGATFALNCATDGGRTIAVRGRPAGGHLAVFFEARSQEAALQLDFRATVNALPMPVWIRGRDQTLAFVNRAFLATAGTTEEDAMKANVVFDRSERDLAATALSNQETVEAKRFAIIAGHRRALSYTLAPLPEGGVAGAALDVTDVAEAETRLQRHIDAHSDMLHALTTAVVIFGPDQRVNYYNHAFVRLWGLSEVWLESRPRHGELLDRLRELRRLPEQPDFRAWKQLRTRMFERRDNHPEELWHLPSGQTLRVTARPHPMGGVVILYDDVSTQLRLESSYNTLIKVQKATLDALHEGVAVFGLDGRLKLYNAAFARIWRLESDELSGEPHLKRIAESCAARLGGDRSWEIVISSVTSAAAERNREWREIERSDGTVIALNIAPLPDGATLLSFADVTDRFRIESALRERNEALEASDNLKSEFVKRMSYELRTPLNSIVGFAQMMKGGITGPLNERQSEYVEAIVAASDTLRNLVSGVLDLSQIEAGAMELELERLDLYLLLFGVAEHAREWAAKIGLTFILDCKEDAGQFVADSRRLKQVVFNLISNALKYTPQNGSVTLAGEIRGEDVRISVQDTGPGVPTDFMPSAFERFTAKGNAVGRPGAGLGLALVNRFVELHGGWVELESNQSGGTRVTCHLPRNLSKQIPKKPADMAESA
ncbi:MAG TPA: ATP-binding protein [Micropepsaceae bacterium]|nr:ATP-binding protein [Micropepsaceae bacterium]